MPPESVKIMRVPTLQPINDTQKAAVEKAKLKGACDDFEAVLTNILFKSMRETIAKAGIEAHDNAMELYESMLDETVAKELSRGPGLGLGKLLYQQLASQLKPQR